MIRNNINRCKTLSDSWSSNNDEFGWAHRDIPLPELRDRINALIAQYGEKATLSIRGDNPVFEIEWVELETEEQFNKRIEDDLARNTLYSAAKEIINKLSEEEQKVLWPNGVPREWK